MGQEDEIGMIHIEHSVIQEHHTYYKDNQKQSCVDVALYNQCFSTIQSYIKQNKPAINEETTFLLNVIKDAYRKTQLQIERQDLIFELCKNQTIAEKWQEFNHMTDWLIMEARH